MISKATAAEEIQPMVARTDSASSTAGMMTEIKGSIRHRRGQSLRNVKRGEGILFREGASVSRGDEAGSDVIPPFTMAAQRDHSALTPIEGTSVAESMRLAPE
jgi:hypothetical protein